MKNEDNLRFLHQTLSLRTKTIKDTELKIIETRQEIKNKEQESDQLGNQIRSIKEELNEALRLNRTLNQEKRAKDALL